MLEEVNGEIRISKPGRPGRLNDQMERAGGVAGATLIDWRPALSQHLTSSPAGAASADRAMEHRYRFQFELRADDPEITKGSVVEFRGGRDPVLNSAALQVTSAKGSGHSTIRKVLATTEFGARA